MEFASTDFVWVNAVDQTEDDIESSTPMPHLVSLKNIQYIAKLNKEKTSKLVKDIHKPLCFVYRMKLADASLYIWTRKELPSDMFTYLDKKMAQLVFGLDDEETTETTEENKK